MDDRGARAGRPCPSWLGCRGCISRRRPSPRADRRAAARRERVHDVARDQLETVGATRGGSELTMRHPEADIRGRLRDAPELARPLTRERIEVSYDRIA